MKRSRIVFIIVGSIVLAGVLMFAIVLFSPLTTAEQRIKKKAQVNLVFSGCKIEQETNTKGWMGDGEYLLVLDFTKNENSIIEQTHEFFDFPLSANLQTMMFERGVAKQIGIPTLNRGKWYFYDRFSDEIKDRRSDELLLTRPA